MGPLVIDVDGTLLRTGLAWEAALAALGRDPAGAVGAVWLGLRDRLAMKTALARLAEIDSVRLPANAQVLALALEANRAGREVVLLSSFPKAVVQEIAEIHGITARIIASDAGVHLQGRRKLDALRDAFGEAGFDYAGNSGDDLPIWKEADNVIVVGASPRVEAGLVAMGKNLTVLQPRWSWWDLWAAMRPLRTLRSGLALLPLVSVTRVEPSVAMTLTWTILALALLTAAFHLISDLADLQRDRADRTRRSRLFARGALPLGLGLAAAGGTAALGLVLGAMAGPRVFVLLGLFALLSLAHAFWLNHRVALELASASVLDLLRVGAGAAVLGLGLTEAGVLQLAALFFIIAALARIARRRDAAGERLRPGGALVNLLILAGAALAFLLLMRVWTAPVLLALAAVLIGAGAFRLYTRAQRPRCPLDPVFGLPRAPVALGCLAIGALILGRFGACFTPLV